MMTWFGGHSNTGVSLLIRAVVQVPSTGRSLTHHKITGLSEAADVSHRLQCHVWILTQQAGTRVSGPNQALEHNWHDGGHVLLICIY
jgi:hypothetical protein